MSTLDEVRSWLEDQYLNQLGIVLQQPPAMDVAVWAMAETKPEGVIYADLYDAEIGLWLKFIEITAVESVRETVNRSVFEALTLSSQLLHKTGIPVAHIDPNGGWSLGLFFLAPESCREQWEYAIKELRSQSGFTEELAIDVIFLDDVRAVATQLRRNSIPQLMFSTRKLLRIPVERLEAWSTADSEVAELLKVLPDKFANADDRQLVESLVSRASKESEPSASPARSWRSIDTINIKNLRNIADFEFVLREASGGVSTRIVHGPNGTGKSSLFEALSLAVAGSSRRLHEYLVDQDEGRTHDGASYVSRVLADLDGPQRPEVEADGKPVLSTIATTAQEAEKRLLETDGNLLAQEDARLFVGTRGVDLGSRVLRNYSRLARAVQKTCAEEYQAANVQRQNWLRKFGISASIRRDDSRFKNLVAYFLAEDFPSSPQVVAWLQAVEARMPFAQTTARSLARGWSTVDERSRRDQLAMSIDQWQSFGTNDDCAKVIQQWLDERELVLRRLDALRIDVDDKSIQLGAHRSEIESDLKEWRGWLSQPGQAGSGLAEGQTDDDKAEKEVAIKLAELKAVGLALAEHLQHVQQVREKVMPTWSRRHPDECPTCGANHHSEGGITLVLARLVEKLEDQLSTARQQYADLLAKAKGLSQRRAVRGECPLSSDRRSYVAQLLGTDNEGFEVLEARLVNGESFIADVLRSIDLLLVPLTIHRTNDPAQAARSLWDRIAAENSRGIALWELPERWSRIKAVVDTECEAIVREHLPQTLEAVWTELALVMTPARWNLPDYPKMLSASTRAGDSLRLVVGRGQRVVGVRHIFNQAESHVLGLAWFFTQYLAAGRAKVPLMALDDPAQEMDQTTFRAFLRLAQSLCRLHRRLGIPLTFIMFLHQEDRALDAARATCQQITSLKWSKRISGRDSVEQVILMSPDFKAPLPPELRGSVEFPASPVRA